ncbi:MAG: VOC family protein [SAR324 cluster bacterium]|nr:VOC family protein [SAR324 cluster bacterium]
MNLFSIRIITNDVKKSVQFYEKITGIAVTQHIENFAEFITESAILAIGNPQTLKPFDGTNVLEPNKNSSVALEFRVKDVDDEYIRLADFLQNSIIQKPKMMPWGNKSFLFRDPDGNLINFFTPTTPEAIKRWGTEKS